MPMEFDPAWEYFMGNPDVEQILKESTRKRGIGLAVDMIDNNPIPFRIHKGPGNTRQSREELCLERGLYKEWLERKTGKSYKACRYCTGPVICKNRYTKRIKIFCSENCADKTHAARARQQLVPGRSLVSLSEWCSKRHLVKIKAWRGRIWFVLQYIEGIPVTEIASMFNVTVNAVGCVTGYIYHKIKETACTLSLGM